MPYSHNSLATRLVAAAFISSALLLTGCGIAVDLAKESVVSLTERTGREHFTLAGSLPANFKLSAVAHYQVLDVEKCQVRDFTSSGTRTRVMGAEYDTALEAHPHEFSLQIPLTRHIGLCHAELSRVRLNVTGYYGEENWQKDGHGGGIAVVDTRPAEAPRFAEDGTMLLRGMCGWMFQLSKASSRKGQVSKLLHCSQPDENWSQSEVISERRGLGVTVGRDELADKTIVLDIREDSNEEPYYRDTWIQFPEGWKPCEPKPGGWISCQEPPVFKTFQMNGQECTVYPNCTE